MKHNSILLAASLLVACSLSAWAQKLTDKGWPRTFTSGATSFAVYQPQVELWKDNRLAARAAIAVTTNQNKTPAYGVLWFSARTEIDKTNRLVTLNDFAVTKVSFPANPERAATLQTMLQAQAPKAGEVIALDRLLADMAIAQAKTTSAGHQLNNTPPQIFFSTHPAILVLIDGAPAWRPIKDTRLQRALNTRVLLVRDETRGKFYLHLMDGWLDADSLAGPWSIAWSLPGDLRKAVESAESADLLEGAGEPRPKLSAAAARNALPLVYVSDKPAELLQAQGEPQFAPIAGTQLLYVTNSENDIFVEAATQQRYVLLAGRWFRAVSLQGPWAFVERLPADFARIPATHEKASVLASVAGTPQAKEALIANEIPQTATITRNAAALTVSYDGAPQFKTIESTTLRYAVNTATPVIAVSSDSYYAVANGVWFSATAATGPWMVAASVPSAIYTIPPSSPLHHVTYVKVYGATPEVVYVGYTPGYHGTVVSSDSNVVVYGTGWYAPPYVGTYWYGAACTYGYGAGFTWSVAGGWGVAYGIGYGWSNYYYPAPVYGAANVYGQWGNVAYAGTRAAWANPYTGNVGRAGAVSGVNTATGTRYNGRAFTNTNAYTGTTVSGAGGAAYNPYTGRAAAGQAGAVSNAYTGNAAAGARGAHYNPNTGVVSGGAAGATYNAATGQVTADGRGFKYNTRTDTGVAVGKNNVYAGHDGAVYRYNQGDGLQHRTSDGWQTVNRSAEAQNLQNARAAGQQRWESFRGAGGLNGNTGVVGPRNGGAGSGLPQIGSGNGPRFGGGSGPRFGGGGGPRIRR
jgi:hypothetical protein